MIDIVTALVLLPFEVVPPSAAPSAGGVYPQQGNGFAAYIVGGFFGLGILILATVLLSMKPKRVDPKSL